MVRVKLINSEPRKPLTVLRYFVFPVNSQYFKLVILGTWKVYYINQSKLYNHAECNFESHVNISAKHLYPFGGKININTPCIEIALALISIQCFQYGL